jgi:hypothetical protein
MKSLIVRLFSACIILLLMVSSFTHLSNPYLFLGDADGYRIAGRDATMWVSIVLPMIQLVLALSIMMNMFDRTIFILSAVLFAFYIFLQTSAVIRGLDISCGCFGQTESKIGLSTMAPALCGLILSLSCLFLSPKFNLGQFHSIMKDKHEI